MALLILTLFSMGAPDAVIERLNSPQYGERERADWLLRQQTQTWVGVLRLESIAAQSSSPEVRVRLIRIIADWWNGAAPLDWRKAPHIDSLNRAGSCDGNCDTWISRVYLARAYRECPFGDSGTTWPQYRFASWLLVRDLIRWRIPPLLIRALLSVMRSRTEKWERRIGP